MLVIIFEKYFIRFFKKTVRKIITNFQKHYFTVFWKKPYNLKTYTGILNKFFEKTV